MKDPPASYEYPLDPAAANNTAASIYALARAGGPRVLDLGSGPAIVSSELARVEGKSVVCVDAREDLLAAARARGIERTVRADLENDDWATPFAGERFDVIILADVLEHLRAPEDLLATIRKLGLLARDGYLVVSIPNAAHEVIIAQLLGGRFTYRETGLLDSTHIRWFTRQSFAAFAEQSGFAVTQVHRTVRTIEQTLERGDTPIPPREFRAQLERINPELKTYQFVMRLDPVEMKAPVRIQDGAPEETLQLHVPMDELESTKAELRAANEEAAKVRAALRRIYSSRTWRARNATVRILRALRRLKLPRR